MVRNEFDNIKVKDQLGRPDETGIDVIRKSDTFLIEEEPLVVIKYDTSNAAVYDTAVYGTDIYFDYDGAGVRDIDSVSSKNDTFLWRFRYGVELSTDNVVVGWGFTDEDNSTATEDVTTNFRVDFTSGQVWTSLELFKSSESNIVSAILETNETGTLSWEMTADGTNWESVTLGVEHNFTNVGNDLRARATETGATTATITFIKVAYLRG